MKILVIGLGALGTVYSCLLKKKGHQVVGMDQEPVIKRIRESGVKVTGIWGEHLAKLDSLVTSVDEIKDSNFDLVVMAVKSYNTQELTSQIKKVLSSQTYVMLAQNGYGNFEIASEHIPQEKLIVARVIFGAETMDLGVSKVTVIADDVVIGSPKNLIQKNVLADFAGVFTEAGIPTRASDSVMEYVWGKIIYNSALNSLGAILEVNYGKLGELEFSRHLMNDIIREIFTVLDLMKQKTLWDNAEVYLKDFYEKLIPVTASHHASMLQDIQRGRKTEIDALNGAIVKLGKKYGLATPVNEVITKLVKAKENLVELT